jgi:hypothetical protein
MMKSKYIDIPREIVKKLSDDDEENLKILNENVRWLADAKDGDCLVVDRNGYRNDGKYLWDAEEQKIVSFSRDVDDYGCIPKNFDLRRFHERFFADILAHNSYVRLGNDLIDQIVRNATYGFAPDIDPKERVWSYFFIKKTKYIVIGIAEDCLYPNPEIIQEGNRPGELIVSFPEQVKHSNDRDIAIHFMRIFIESVKNQMISFNDSERYCLLPEYFLIVHC